MKHRNNFDLLRFLFAFVVFLVHAHILTGNTDLAPLSQWLSSGIAIKGFFVISGYLVFMSHENSRSIFDYLEKRTRRIYPAYFAVICLCAAAGAFVTSRPPAEYFSFDLLKYLAANLSFLNFLAYTLPGVFSTNPLPTVNGALWTLKIEVLFYLCVPLIALLARRWGHLVTMSLLYVLSLAYSFVMMHRLGTTGDQLYAVLARQLPGQLTYFVAGMACYHYRQMLASKIPWLLIPSAVVFMTGDRVVSTVAEPLALAALVIYFATGFRYLGNFGRFGDLSYGVYIVHFPILQGTIAAGAFGKSAYVGLIIAAALVLVAAFLSWHLIEKRWLRKSSHYVLAADPTQGRS